MAYKRDYQKEYDNYQGTEEQKKRRAQRNKDRREAVRKYGKDKLKGKDIDHLDYNVSNHSGSNKRIVDKSKNRSKNKHHKGEKQNHGR